MKVGYGVIFDPSGRSCLPAHIRFAPQRGRHLKRVTFVGLPLGNAFRQFIRHPSFEQAKSAPYRSGLRHSTAATDFLHSHGFSFKKILPLRPGGRCTAPRGVGPVVERFVQSLMPDIFDTGQGGTATQRHYLLN
jgi:hypothetical protein